MSATGDHARAGFTLIEALVVVAVAALISGLAFPRLSAAIDAQEFRTATATIHAGLQAARAAAIRSGVAARFQVADGGHGFLIDGGAVITVPQAVRIALSGGQAIAFYPDGSATGGVVTISGAAPAVRLTVAPSTGRVVATTA